MRARSSGWTVDRARGGLGSNLNLPVPAWRVLTAVAQSPDHPRVSELARRLRQTRQSTHETALDVEAKSWLRLASCSSDRRLQRVSLTPTGERPLAVIEHNMRRLLLEVTNDIPLRDPGRRGI